MVKENDFLRTVQFIQENGQGGLKNPGGGMVTQNSKTNSENGGNMFLLGVFLIGTHPKSTKS